MTSRDKEKGCSEFKSMSRRNFLGLSGAGIAAMGLPSWFPQMAFSQTASCPPCTVIMLFGRGGWDGLSICPPWSDGYYQTIRPVPNPPLNSDTLGFDAPTSSSVYKCLDLDGYWGLASAFPLLHQHPWANNDFAVAHATGYTSNHSYSHFVGQYQLEVGQPNPPISLVEGWLARHLQSRTLPTGCNNPIIRGLGYGVGKQRSIFGGTDCIAAPDPTNYNLQGSPATLNFRLDALRDMYVAEGIFDDVAQATVNTILQLNTVNFAGYTSSNGMGYPNHNLGQSFKTIAAIMDASQSNQNLGVEVFAVDYGSWDHHTDQDPHNQFTPGGEGKMHRRMREMDEALTSFYLDLQGKGYNNYVVYGMSEFGRTNKENGGMGTDHAKGNCMLFMGPRVNGGNVYVQNWDPMGLVNMVEGNDLNDLKITTDVRHIATELIDKCLLNIGNIGTIFPNYTPPAPANYLNIFN